MTLPPLKIVEKELHNVEECILDFHLPPVRILEESARRVLGAFGKKIRPALVLLSAMAFGEVNQKVRKVSALVEIVHMASLLHDDVVDNNIRRRGKLSVNALWSNKISVLLADYLITHTIAELCTAHNIEIIKIISETTARMATGQLRELQFQNDFNITIDDYFKIVKEKTASLMSASSRLGAILSGATQENIEALAEFGENLGISFQIMDDYLDYWGSEKSLGKPVGSDLAEKNFTIPFIHALNNANQDELARLKSLVANGKIRKKDYAEILDIMEKRGSRTFAVDLAREFAEKAKQSIASIPSSEAKEALFALADYMTKREI